MSSSEQPPDAEPEAQPIERAKLDLERRKLDLDGSFPKKWGAVFFSGAATICVALISASASLISVNWQSELTERARVSEERQRKIENTRTALEIYFKNLGALEPGNMHAVQHMRMIAEIADNDGVKTIFTEMRSALIDTRLATARSQGAGKTITDVVAGLPSVSVTTSDRTYVPSDYSAYIQFPDVAGRPEFAARAEQTRSALEAIGIRVPGIEAVPPAQSPKANEIRLYRSLQKVTMAGLPEGLKEATGLDFNVQVLSRKNLPDGIIEIWIGSGR